MSGTPINARGRLSARNGSNLPMALPMKNSQMLLSRADSMQYEFLTLEVRIRSELTYGSPTRYITRQDGQLMPRRQPCEGN
jgi:hypothetical protein